MNSILLSTTGLTPSIILNDLGERVFNHPITNYNIGLEFEYYELISSKDFNFLLDSGYFTINYNGIYITNSYNFSPATPANAFQGPTGSQGLQGPQGLIGPQGFQGFEGVQGLQGLTGSQGLQGLQGFQGVQGFEGVQGLQGLTGSQGLQGLQGFQGATGVQGANNILDANNGLNINSSTISLGGTLSQNTLINGNNHSLNIINTKDYRLTTGSGRGIIVGNTGSTILIGGPGSVATIGLDTINSYFSWNSNNTSGFSVLFDNITLTTGITASWQPISGTVAYLSDITGMTIGPTGPQGFTGPQGTGPQGGFGPTGVQGIQGPAGSGTASGLSIIARASVNINKGQAVYITSWDPSGIPNVGLADSSNIITMPAIGIALTNVTTGNTFSIVKNGYISNIDTSLWNISSPIYVSTSGALTNTRPNSNSQEIGVVYKSGFSDGILYVNVNEVIQSFNRFGTYYTYSFDNTETTTTAGTATPNFKLVLNSGNSSGQYPGFFRVEMRVNIKLASANQQVYIDFGRGPTSSYTLLDRVEYEPSDITNYLPVSYHESMIYLTQSTQFHVSFMKSAAGGAIASAKNARIEIFRVQ
jgi:hypothetical protein